MFIRNYSFFILYELFWRNNKWWSTALTDFQQFEFIDNRAHLMLVLRHVVLPDKSNKMHIETEWNTFKVSYQNSIQYSILFRFIGNYRVDLSLNRTKRNKFWKIFKSMIESILVEFLLKKKCIVLLIDREKLKRRNSNFSTWQENFFGDFIDFSFLHWINFWKLQN